MSVKIEIKECLAISCLWHRNGDCLNPYESYIAHTTICSGYMLYEYGITLIKQTLTGSGKIALTKDNKEVLK